MDNFVITIARQYGSGGRTIGEELAKKLGISYYDKDIIRMASEESGIHEQLFGRADENVSTKQRFFAKSGIYKGELIPPQSKDFTSDENLFNYQAKIIRELADKESCVIIGRAADYVLKDYDNVVSVFVHASKDYCVRQAIERSAYTGKDVEKFVERTDKYRSDFYRYYTGQEWTDARNYDLCLNSERLGFEGTMEAIEEYIKVRFGALPGTKKNQ